MELVYRDMWMLKKHLFSYVDFENAKFQSTKVQSYSVLLVNSVFEKC